MSYKHVSPAQLRASLEQSINWGLAVCLSSRRSGGAEEAFGMADCSLFRRRGTQARQALFIERNARRAWLNHATNCPAYLKKPWDDGPDDGCVTIV